MTAKKIAQKQSPYSPAELAELYNVTESIIRRRCRDGLLPYFRLGKLYRFTPEVAHAESTRQILLVEADGGPSPVYRRPVYFVVAETGQIKIGIARDVEQRLANLQAASPVKLEIAAITDGGLRQEKKYHRQFAEHRLHGEWFSPHPDILAEIARLTGADR